MSAIKFYQSDNDSRKINKVLTGGTEVNCNIRTDIDIYNPVLILRYFDDSWNYFQWDNRYYFIRDKIYTANKIWQIQAHIDPLMTYRDSILSSMCYLSRSVDISPYFDGGDYNSLVTSDITIIKSDVTLPRTETTVLITTGTRDSLPQSGTTVTTPKTEDFTW